MAKTSLLLSIFLIITPMASSISESDALLKLKKSFTNAQSLNSWKPGSEPCATANKWVGLLCFNGNVYGLHLGQMGLSGKIDVEALVQIPGLRSLSFVNNSFSGSIPELNRMGALKSIYLSGNQFSGEISPNYFAKMDSLKKVWLSGNNFSGEIPSSLARLPVLIELHLENNHFLGEIPPFNLPNLVSLDLSNNDLRGEIPPGLSKFNASSFLGNPGLCGAKLGTTCNHPGTLLAMSTRDEDQSAEPNGHHAEESRRIAYLLLIAAGVILGFMLVGIFVLKGRQEAFDVIESENSDESVGIRVSSESKNDVDFGRKSMNSSRKGSNHGRGVGDLVVLNDKKGVFGMADLMRAGAEVLGNGSLGSAYKATLSNGFTVVVKRIKEMNKMGKDGFDAEIRRIGRLQHQNILLPVAYHCRKEEKLLVYEYIPKGSLLYLLHGDRGPGHAELTWPARLNIVQGIAQGLGYLHTELASYDVPHGDLKSSNVLLGPDFTPLLTDFGFGSLVNSNQAAQSLIGYMSPEAIQHRHFSPKCDVYCLGIIILEILTGQFPSNYLSNGKGGTDVVQWVNSSIAEGREAELLDPEISSSGNSLVEMVRLLHIGAACTEGNPQQRFDISEAIRRIEEIQVDGGQEERTFHVLPSLRDGYAESPSQMQGYTRNVSQRRHGGLGDRSGCLNCDSFTFDVS